MPSITSYIHIYLDPENPGGDECAFETEQITKVLKFLNENARSVPPQ